MKHGTKDGFLGQVRVDGMTPYGIVVLGQHDSAAIRVPENQFVSLDSSNQVKFRREGTKIQFYNSK